MALRFHHTLFRLLTAGGLLLTLCCACSSAVIRVKPTGDDASDGSAWALAKRTVQAAINAAQAGDEVWVAGAKDQPYFERITLKDGVGLYGGFAGNETDRDARDWAANVTVLDGAGTGDVVTVPAGTSSGSVLDGFTVRHGLDGIDCASSSPTIANNCIADNEGSGIRCLGAGPVIRNNTITGNKQLGIHCADSSAPRIVGNKIVSNWSDGIRCANHSSPHIANNVVRVNRDRGIACEGASSPQILSNIVAGNASYGVFCIDASSPQITNNTIAGNGQGIYCQKRSSPTISNNIVAFNAIGVARYDHLDDPSLRNNCIYNPGGVDYEGLNPGTGDIRLDPTFEAAEYGQLHIQPDSPCVDSGLDSPIQPEWTDIDGQPRTQGDGVDIGADEADGTLWPQHKPVVVRVSMTGSDDALHDGTSWALAKRTLQAGIDVAAAVGGEVWVASGTYTENPVSLLPYAYVLGGFSRTEDSRDQRDWVRNTTILRGNTAGTLLIARGFGACELNGFVLTRCGSAVHCAYAAPRLANNTILQAQTIGISCSSAAPVITNNAFRDCGTHSVFCAKSSPLIANNAIAGGPNANGIYCTDGSHPTITNNTITGCGAGIRAYSSYAIITNNIVAFNGMGIAQSGGTPVLRNNCVYTPDGLNYDNLGAGEGDIQHDPLFVARESGDYHLRASSLCVGAGVTAAVSQDWTDMDGQPRLVGAQVDIGADEVVPVPLARLAEAKAGPLDTAFTLEGMVASTGTTDFGGHVFVQDPGRACGMRLNTSAPVNRGDLLILFGYMRQVDGECQIECLEPPAVTSGSAPVPLQVSQKSLATDRDENLTHETGLEATGLLVTVNGRVTRINTTHHVLYVNDGTNLADGMGPSDNPYIGVRVSYRTFTPPAVGKRVAVTGILRVEKTVLAEDAFVNGEYRLAGETLYLPVLFPRTQDDIVLLL